AELERRRQGCGNLGQHRHAVLLAEQCHCRLPARDLRDARTQEDSGDGETEQKLVEGHRDTSEPFEEPGDTLGGLHHEISSGPDMTRKPMSTLSVISSCRAATMWRAPSTALASSAAVAR